MFKKTDENFKIHNFTKKRNQNCKFKGKKGSFSGIILLDDESLIHSWPLTWQIFLTHFLRFSFKKIYPSCSESSFSLIAEARIFLPLSYFTMFLLTVWSHCLSDLNSVKSTCIYPRPWRGNKFPYQLLRDFVRCIYGTPWTGRNWIRRCLMT